MKSCTDLGQSQILAKILSHDTADQTWQRVVIAGANLDVPKELQYRHNGDMPFRLYNGVGVPCWSLASLFDVIKDKCGYFELVYLKRTTDGRANPFVDVCRLSTDVYDVCKIEAVDACYEMIIRLYEQKLL